MSIYPSKISDKFRSPKHAGKTEPANAVGTEASFVCGCFVRFYLMIERASKDIQSVQFQTNGCGFMIASAEALAETIEGKKLVELHGLESDWLNEMIDEELGFLEVGRVHCRETCLNALHAAFADYRAFELEEFQGERALICTCFGVSEDTIEQIISEKSPQSVGEVAELCNAGGGCGSCRMLIQEMIDDHGRSAATRY